MFLPCGLGQPQSEASSFKQEENMAINMTDEWLQGVRARVAGMSRSAVPYGQHSFEMGNTAIQRANEWFSGWDTANIILGFHAVKEPT